MPHPYSLLCLALPTLVLSNVLDASLATWRGRTTQAPFNVSFSWEGVSALFTIDGATNLNLQATTQCPTSGGLFHTIIDDKLVLNWTLPNTPGGVNISIACMLDGGKHTVRIFYATDPITVSWDKLPPWFHTFVSFSSDGTLSAGPPPPTRRLQIIGDSITAGNQINAVTCDDDNWGSYGQLICDQFDADCQTLAISGKGIYQNCCDFNETMTTLFERTFVGSPTPLWDNTQFKPDGVLLALGTNDQGHNNGTQWVQGFEQTYANFLMHLSDIHGGNKNLPIFCLIGPITLDYYPWVLNAVQSAVNSGLSNVHIVNFTAPLDRCSHPPWSSHILMAEQLAPVIKQVMGW